MLRETQGKRALATFASGVAVAMLAAIGPIDAASAASAPETTKYGLGAVHESPSKRSDHPTAEPVHAVPKAAPASYSLEKYDDGPGNQGQVNSCVAWAIDYSSMNILENEQGIEGHPQAPMYTYAQIVKGENVGTSLGSHFEILTTQGIDTQEHYGPDEYDYTTQPTEAERENAANWKLSGYTDLGAGSDSAEKIKESIASGLPVVVTLDVHDSFYDVSDSEASDYSYMPGDEGSDPVNGGHAVTAIAYDDKGLRLENSWGTDWGDGGYINVSWDYVAQEIKSSTAIGKLEA